MRNDIFLVVTTTVFVGFVAVLLCWLDGQQKYLLAHWTETDAANIEPAYNSAPETSNAQKTHFCDGGTFDTCILNEATDGAIAR